MRYLAFLFFPLALIAQTLPGVVDVHVHADPDSSPRLMDAIDLAKLARTRGMRGLLFKNHFESTAALAYLVRKAVPGIETYGGIVLNRSVGGMNPAAIEQMASLKGGWGRVVWMPTRDAESQVLRSQAKRPFVSVSLDGQLRPEVKDVLTVIAKHKLALATGHVAPEESLLIIREARHLGIERIVVTHALGSPNMSVPQMKEAAKLGAYIEFCYLNTIGEEARGIQAFTAAIRAVGTEHCILSTDLGQPGNPTPPDGFAAFINALQNQGFTQAEIDQMAKKNPAALLGLP